MTVRLDPEGVLRRPMTRLVDFPGKEVLEVGCGRGRMTRPCASQAASVLGIVRIHRPVRPGVGRALPSPPGF